MLVIPGEDEDELMQKHRVRECIFAAMKAHLDSVDVQNAGCRALANYCVFKKNTGIYAREAVECICAAMNAHPGDANVLEAGCGALRNLAHENAAYMREHGAVECVCAAMNAHRSVEVQRQGCHAMRSLSAGILADTYHIEVLEPLYIRQRLAVESVLAAMDTHRGVVDIQEAGAFALYNLNAVSHLFPSQSIRPLAECVCAAMNAHRGVTCVQEAGCYVLRSITETRFAVDANQIMTNINQIMTNICAAMETHRDHKNIPELGCEVLYALALHSDENRVLMLEHGVVECASAAGHPSDKDTLLLCLRGEGCEATLVEPHS
eukprot:gnl/Spiro4/21313_TR10402_c2_g1_i2.p1 gnl/Spiro4/21313_TR10402_c2_g1~~gnl/Spiro4/21313_TR10402_c2_g1_i2.p1  ORF type:complete len:321 (-),score=17.89 gnl/Spiro4/21313_TR10402_c2_g1_i2:84-1046(-)